MIYELVFEKYVSDPEYEYDDCRRVALLYVKDSDLSADLGFDVDLMPEPTRLVLALAKGLTNFPAGYHFCCFGALNKEEENA